MSRCERTCPPSSRYGEAMLLDCTAPHDWELRRDARPKKLNGLFMPSRLAVAAVSSPRAEAAPRDEPISVSTPLAPSAAEVYAWANLARFL